MFGFFGKKKEKEPKKKIEENDKPLSDDEKKSLSKLIEEIKLEISTAESQASIDQNDLALKYEKLGLTYDQLNELDMSVAALEKSLDAQLSIGDGYKKLMSLYNKKRAESARNGDDQGIEYYMGKMDEMRQIAKKVTISG